MEIETNIGKLHISNNDVDDLMSIILDGDCTTAWVYHVRTSGNMLGEYASDQISRGGSIVIEDIDGGKHHLNAIRLKRGIAQAVNENYLSEYNWFTDTDIVVDGIDSEVGDAILQYALFGELVYG